MSTRDPHTEPSDPPPSGVMTQLIAGFWVPRALYIAAKLGIADLLAAGLRLTQIIPTPSPMSVIEIVRV